MFSPNGVRADPDITTPDTLGTISRGSSLLGIFDDQPTEQEIEDTLIGTFYACIKIRAHAAANAVTSTDEGMGWEVVRRTDDGFEPAEDSPWRGLLRRPNEHRSAYRIWFWAFMQRLLRGRVSFIVGDGAGGIPESLHEVYTVFGYMRSIESRDGGVDSYVYHREDGERIRLEPEDVVESMAVHPTSPYEGYSVLDALWQQVNQERYANKYMSQSYREGRPPMVYLSSDHDLTEQEMTRYGQEFSDKFLQQDRKPDFAAHSTIKEVPVFGSGTEVKSPSIDPDSWQMIESMGLTQEMIHTVTGVPKTLYQPDTGNRAADRQAFKTLIRLAVQPDVTAMAADLTRGLERAFGAEPGALKVRAPDAMPTDEERREKIAQKRIERGVPPAEVMEEQGEEVPDEHEDILSTPHLPGTLKPAGQQPEPDLL